MSRRLTLQSAITANSPFSVHNPQPSIALKADSGFSFSFDDGEKTVTIKFERDDIMKMVYTLTKALDTSGVKYSIKTSKRNKR